MNYPLISEYIESIKAAEDNFEKLNYLRPVLDADGQPVMTSGNFAVVFKMKDERDGKQYAVKCFTKEQQGREDAYRLIADELQNVVSPYIVPIKYLEKELFVDSKQTDETEFPVLLMDWVKGKTLDKYLRENLEDQYALEMLAYRFSQLAQWLIPQPFSHGDLKPDNILVREDGTLVLVDYDGMYVPAMKGQKARELGSPDFRHPLRAEDDFDEHIDDFPIATILLSLKAIAIQPDLLEQYGATDRFLLSESDYQNISQCKLLKDIFPSEDSELNVLQSLFMISLVTGNLSTASSNLFNLSRPKVPEYENLSTKVTEEDLANAWVDEYGVKYSADRKRLLKAPKEIKEYTVRQCLVICDHAFEGCSSLTSINIPKGITIIGWCAFQGCSSLTSINIPASVIEIGQFAFADCSSLVSIVVDNLNPVYDSRNDCNAIIETNNNKLVVGCCNTIIPKGITVIGGVAFEGCSSLTSINIPKGITIIGWCAFQGCSSLTSINIPASVIKIGHWAFTYCSSLVSIVVDNLNPVYDSRNDCNAIIETKNNKLVVGCCNTIIPESVTVIGEVAFYGCSSLTSINIPEGVLEIGDFAFSCCSSLISINIPKSVTKIGICAFQDCSSLTSINIPASILKIAHDAFQNCSSLTSFIIPIGCREHFEELLPEYKDKLVEQ